MKENIQDFFLNCRECVLENPRHFYGCFYLGPFQNSQSLTVANALRRTLLTEISGIAITHIEIEKVFHEYSTLQGVRESVLDILLNFKQIVLKTSSTFSKPVYGYLNVRGPGIVRASNLKLPPFIQSVDPDQYIATLNENGKLSLKFTISDSINSLKNGDSFQNSFHDSKLMNFENSFPPKKKELQQNFSQKIQKQTNSLWVDPFFNPIFKVNYLIETIHPVEQNIFNQVIQIELWTNGSIHPRKALYEALAYLKNMFEKLENMKFFNFQLLNRIFESEEKTTKILKSFEYDFQFYSFLEYKKNQHLSLQKFPQKKQPQKIQPHLFSQFQNNNSQTNNLAEKTPVFLPSFQKEVEAKAKREAEIPFFQYSQESLLAPVSSSDTERVCFAPELGAKSITQMSPMNRVDFSIQELKLPYRISYCLIKNNFLTVHDLLKLTPKQLKKFCGIGNFSVRLIQKKLKEMGLQLNTEKINQNK